MIRHVVVWKLKEQAHGLDKEALIKEMTARLEALPKLVPGVKFFQVGRNTGPAPAESARDLILISDFESWATLKAYAEHPEHLKVIEFVKQAVDERRVVDFEVA